MHKSDFSPKDFARLDRRETHVVRNHVQKHGHYLGVVPTKLDNGRLVFPRGAVLRALGLVPTLDGAPLDCRRVMAFAKANGVPIDETSLVLIATLVNATPNCRDGRDPAVAILEHAVACVDVVQGFAGRLKGTWASLDARGRTDTLAVIRDMVNIIAVNDLDTEKEGGAA